MNIKNEYWKILAIAISLIAIMISTEISFGIIFILIFIGIIISMGIIINEKLISLSGFFIITIFIGYHIKIETLSELQFLGNAIIGIFLPIFVIARFAFISNLEESDNRLQFTKKPILIAIIFIICCILSVPAGIYIIGFLIPNISMQISELSEILIIIIVASIGIILLLSRK